MSGELQSYYDSFRTGYWAEEDETACPCRGNGWALSDVDTWHECPIHFEGQLHPDAYESYPVEGGGIEAAEAADYLSRVEWAVKRGRASFTREEAARRAPVTRVVVDVDDSDEIPF